MQMRYFPAFFLLIAFSACGIRNRITGPESALASLPALEGKPDYLSSPYVTAGTRVYMIGHQDGTFPDLGWHVKGEMGGIWDHPIKLMDGFYVTLNGKCLDAAYRFLNYPAGNSHFYQFEDLEIERFQFVPDGKEGLVVEYRISNPSRSTRNLDFVFYGLIDLSPVWLSERAGITDGPDELHFSITDQVFTGRDGRNEWYVVFGSNRKSYGDRSEKCPCYEQRAGNGKDAGLLYKISVPGKGNFTLRFFIAGSSESREKALEEYRYLSGHYEDLLEEKTDRYREVAETASLQLPDSGIQQMYTWLKYNTQWLMREVPGFGAGLSAGLPDYPWWFGCDNTYALQGVLCTGQHDLALSTIRLLFNFSGKNGQVVHEVSTNGVVYNPGNRNETPHFIMLLREYFLWTGDIQSLREWFPFVKAGIRWILSHDADGNGYPNGSGMMEIQGLDAEMIDVAVYTQQALEAASEMAGALGETTLSEEYKRKARELKSKIITDWWVEEAGSFADFRSGREKALELVSAATSRARELKKPWAEAELMETYFSLVNDTTDMVKGHVVFHNWVVNTPMETGLADSARAIQALNTASRFSHPFGMYVTGIDRDENIRDQEVEHMRKKVFSYVGAVMTLPTGVQAVAEARYGRMDQTLEYIKMLSRSFSYALPGSLYEVSPDFGMMVQAWNIYGVAVPIVRYFFGIIPDAYNRRIQIRPAMPSDWDEAELKNLPIGNNLVSISFFRTGDLTQYHINQEKEWRIHLVLSDYPGKPVEVNGKGYDRVGEGGDIILNDLDNIVIIKN